MPALFTHYEFSREVLNKLSDKQVGEIESSKEYYTMFNQGWDNIFYNPFHWKKYKRFGIYCHHHNVSDFFKNMILYIKNNNLENDSNLTNMVYGFINHYTIDTIIHPFINYQVKNLNIPHSKIEFIIDTRLRKSNKGNYFKRTIPLLKFSNELLDFIDIVFLSTYDKKNIGKVFNRSHNISYFLYRYFISDKYGIKSKIYKVVDFITPFKELKLHEFTYYVKDFDERILNNNKDTWHHPDNKKEKYNYSFQELFEFCLEIAAKLNTLAYSIIHENGNIDELTKLIEQIDIKNISKLLK